MKLKEQIRLVNTIDEIPTLEHLMNLERGVKLKVVFREDTQQLKDITGEYWKKELSHFSIVSHTIDQEITIVKLITDEEIIEHQDFFEICAQEYGLLGKELITQFAHKFQIKDYQAYPLGQINPYFENSQYKHSGKMGEWAYYIHGMHCAFTHKRTGQHIEVPLSYGEEFGVLDPYFFTDFIHTTPEFKPIPVPIFESYADGKRILDVMLELGKYEKINSNLPGLEGIIVTQRKKKEVIIVKDSKPPVNKKLQVNAPKKRFWDKVKTWLN